MTIGSQPRIVRRQDHERLVSMYKSGSTLADIGAQFGVSRERIRQIVSAYGVTKLHGGQAARLLKETPDRVANLRSKDERIEARVRATWGLSLDDYRAHVAEYGSSSSASSPMHKYIAQRKSANLRGVAWEFTFAEWWAVWQDSGKWDERGRGKYVMARYGDGETPYSKDTVYICTHSQNSKDSYIVSPASVRFANNPTRAGAGRGWYANHRSKINPYYSQFKGKHIGSFPTKELACAAYRAAVEQDKQKA